MEKIDTHAHVVPPVWRKYCEEHGFGKPDGMPAIPVCGHFQSFILYITRLTIAYVGMDIRNAYCTYG